MNKKTIASGLFWKFAERICAQGVSFIISIILARLLMPEDYGIIAIILVFINIAEVFVTSGFSAALIQNKESDAVDFSTIFYCTLGLSILMYILLFIIAPYIGMFYNQPKLADILRVLGIRLIINSFNSVQSAYVSRTMQFRKFFFATSVGTATSAVVGVILAYLGFGPWALVAQYLTNSLIDTIVLFFTIDWHPQKLFSLDRAKVLCSFGVKVMFADLIGTLFNEMRSLVIGLNFSSASLAYYNKAEQFPKLFTDNILNTVSSVLFPALSNVSDSKQKIREMTRTAIRSTCFFIFPLMTGLAILADPIIHIVLTDKWAASVPYMQIACLSYAILPLNNTNVQAIKAMGKGNTYLKIEFIKKTCGIVVIIMASKISVMAVASSAVGIAFIYLIINIIPNGKLLNYGIKEQIIDIIPFIIFSLIMVPFVVITGEFLPKYSMISLLIQVLVGIISYFLLSYLCKNKECMYVISGIKKFLNR